MSDGGPWDVKQIKICVGASDDDKWLEFEVFNNDCWSITEAPGEDNFFMEGLPLESARMLRDFLNYALDEKQAAYKDSD